MLSSSPLACALACTPGDEGDDNQLDASGNCCGGCFNVFGDIKKFCEEKIKIMLSYIQIVSQFPSLFSLEWPPVFRQIVLSVAFFNLEITADLNLDCKAALRTIQVVTVCCRCRSDDLL